MTEAIPSPSAKPVSIAVKLLQAGRFEEAERLFRGVVAVDPQDAAAVAGLASVLKATRRHADAQDLLRQALRRTPGSVVLLGTLGTVLQDRQEEVQAASAFRRALALQPALPPALNNLALSRSRTGDTGAAARLWSAALLINPGFREARLNLLSCLAQRGDHVALRAHAVAALRREPNDPALWLYRVQADRRLRDARRAGTGLRAALAANPAAAALWFELGDAVADLGGSGADAARALERCVCCAPGDARAHYNLGVARGRDGDRGGAAAAYRRALELRPDFREARSNLAITLIADRRFDAALPLLEAALRDDPNDSGAAVALASLLRRRDQAERAEQLLARVLARQPHHPAAMLELTYIEVARGRADRALELALDACALAPQLPELQKRVADLYRDRKAFAPAVRHYDNCMVLLPRSTEAFCHRYHSALELSLAGETGLAVEPWRADMTRTVFAAGIPCPEGFASVPALNAAVVAFAGRHPSLKWEPGDKTTRHGAQTAPTLLSGRTGEIPAALRRIVLQRVEAYLGHLRERGIGFLDAMRPPELRINMWCVFLEPGGHQLTHNHPAGWISGVYYLEIPDSVSEEAGNDGCIEFGRPRVEDYPQAERHPTLTVRPEPGMMVLFPSGLYHRTFPFGSGRRVCLAFDVVDRSLEFHD